MSRLFADLRWRGLISQSTESGLESLADAGGLTFYFGCDPSADSLHVGNLVGLMTMRRLQQAGHKPIALAGGSTGMIGDPSFKASERPLLDEDAIAANVSGIARQLQHFIDFAPGKTQAVMVNNYDWTKDVSILEFLRDVGKHFTVNQMISKESVRARLTEREQGISFTEFSYSLLQAFDYLHLYRTYGCTLQVGGNDQWGNIVAGVDLVRRAAAANVHAFCWPLITKADGTKFGKTESGTVWLDAKRTSPYAFHQFWLRSDDENVALYMKFFSERSREEIESFEDLTRENPRERNAQKALADEVTTLVHGVEETVRAKRAADLLFAGKISEMDESMLIDVFAEVPTHTVARTELGSISVAEALVGSGVSPSKSAARTAIAQGGAYVNGAKTEREDAVLNHSALLHDRYVVLRRGKREFALVRFE